MSCRSLARGSWTRGLFPLLAALLLAGPAAASPLAQGGYSKEDFPRYGLEDVPVPKRWDPIPVEPTEEHVVLRWAEELPDERSRGERRKVRPTLELVSLKVVPDPEGADSTSSGSRRRRGEPDLPVTSVERYLDFGVASTWEQSGETEELDAKSGQRRLLRQYRRKTRAGRGSSDHVGWIFEWRTEDRIQFFLGQCHADDLDEMAKIWMHMATRLKLVEPKEPDLSKWIRHYEKNPKYKDPEFRLRARARLTEVKGWKAEDTENYLLVFSTKDKALIRVLKRELEAIRRAYEEIFPPEEPLTQVSVLRVCKDEAEYLAYGGPSGSGGYWSPVAEELVFYDYQDEGQDRGSGKANSRIVLYHEAFHQYVHYSAGDLTPHSWFNEGTGDFFSGARFDRTGRVSAIGPNPWRVEAIQYYLENGGTWSLRKLFGASKAEYYSKQGAYAQGWSLVYFLRSSREAAKNPDWSRIHPVYYETLKSEWTARRADLLDEGVEPYTETYERGKQAARETALEVALEGVDLRELELAWAEFVRELEL